MASQANPVVFVDLHANKQKIGRVTLELFVDRCPKAVENFRQFCTGESLWRGRPAGYKDTCVHKIIEDKYIEGGDFVNNGVDSRPKVSIWGEDKLFENQQSGLKYTEAGLLSTVNLGMTAGNGNLFTITLAPCPQLQGRGVIFGKVADESSLKVIKSLNALSVNQQYKPKHPVVIKQCGEM